MDLVGPGTGESEPELFRTTCWEVESQAVLRRKLATARADEVVVGEGFVGSEGASRAVRDDESACSGE